MCLHNMLLCAGELNILLIGAGDCRHIMKTLAHCYQHPAIKINVSSTLLFLYTVAYGHDYL